MTDHTQPKVYLANRYEAKDQTRVDAMKLEAYGIEVVSRWHREAPDDEGNMERESDLLVRYAQIDIEDIDACDVLVIRSIEPNTAFVRGGRWVEFGYALGIGKRVIVLGPRENIFCHLPQVEIVSSISEAAVVIQYPRLKVS